MGSEPLSKERLYTEICSDIRATDQISFKLMGLVPLISGAAFLTFFLRREQITGASALVVTLALFAALITLGLFRWEVRNIQRCSWLIRLAEALENDMAVTATAPKRPKAPHGIGKTEAEKFIYSITILAWLSIPLVVLGLMNMTPGVLTAYAILAVSIVFLTSLSVFAPAHVKRIATSTDETSNDESKQTSAPEPSSM